MGTKPSNNFQMDRPESGGADRDDERESSGLLERAKQDFAEAQKAKHATPAREPVDEPGEPGEGARAANRGDAKPNP